MSDKTQFTEVMKALLYDPARVKAQTACPILYSLDQLMEATQGAPNEVQPTRELLKLLKMETRINELKKAVEK